MSGGEYKRRKPHQEEHASHVSHDESNWLVSYADMMTLLFGFFVLMYSLSRFDNTKFDLVSKEIAKYFGGNVSQSAMLIVEQQLSNILKGSGDLEGVEILRSGEENTISLRFDGSVLFESGAVDVNDKAHSTLDKVVQAIRAVEGVKKINIEGHTDNDPWLATDGLIKSNWEVSLLRAGSVLRYFESKGLDRGVMSATGFGDSRPLLPNENETGVDIPANKAVNRRVMVNLTLEDPAAAYRLQQKQFTRKLTKQEIEEQRKKQEMEDKMKSAQAKFQEAQNKFKEAQEEKRKKQQLEKLQKQIEQLENKTKQYEQEAKQLQGQ